MVCFYVVSPKIYSLKDSLNCKLKNMCTFDLFSFLLHCTCMDVGLCEHAYCVHPMAPGWTLTKQVSQHDH